jgi:methionyl-tRNA formyltransferase
VHNQVRGLSPFPGAFFMAGLGKGPERIKVLRTQRAEGDGPPGALLDQRGTVACGEGAVRLVQVQRAGRPPIAAEDFLRGARLPAGTPLTDAVAS